MGDNQTKIAKPCKQNTKRQFIAHLTIHTSYQRHLFQNMFKLAIASLYINSTILQFLGVVVTCLKEYSEYSEKQHFSVKKKLFEELLWADTMLFLYFLFHMVRAHTLECQLLLINL